MVPMQVSISNLTIFIKGCGQLGYARSSKAM